MSDIRVTFPHLGSYYVPFEVLFTKGLEVEYITPPPITQKTLDIGSKYSPDFVCAPFKYNLGNFIESIEAGANTLLQVGGECRLQYYGELHEQIIDDLGYDVKFVNLSSANLKNPKSLYDHLKIINPQMSLKKVIKILTIVIDMAKYIDESEDYIRKNIGFEKISGSFDTLQKEFLSDLRNVTTKKQLRVIAHKHLKELKNIPTDKPSNPLHVGIIGEYYTIMEPFSNHFIEKELAKMGIVVDRWMNVSNSMFTDARKKAKEHISHYAKYNMGATCMMTLDKAIHWAKKKYDGIIHVKSFGCTPETDVIPVLQNISSDYKIPILFFSFDSQTSETGIKTRLEAFYDMIQMRKEKL